MIGFILGGITGCLGMLLEAVFFIQELKSQEKMIKNRNKAISGLREENEILKRRYQDSRTALAEKQRQVEALIRKLEGLERYGEQEGL